MPLSAFDADIDQVRRLLDAGDFDAARQPVARLAAFDHSHVDVQRLKARLHRHDRDWPALLAETARARCYAPHDREFITLRGEALTATGRSDRIGLEQAAHMAADAWPLEERDYLSYEGEILLAERGVLYVAMHEDYVADAICSRASLAQHHPDIPAALVTCVDDLPAGHGFDQVIRAERDFYHRYFFESPRRMPSVKLNYLRRSPFRQTLYLDSDTYLKGPIDALFEALNSADLLLLELCKFRYTSFDGARMEDLFVEGLTWPNVFDTGVMGWRKSARMDHFMDDWLAKFIQLQAGANRHTGNWQTNINEQAVLCTMILDEDFARYRLRRQCVTGWRYNCKPQVLDFIQDYDLMDDVHLLHARGMRHFVAEHGGNGFRDFAFDLPRYRYRFPLTDLSVPVETLKGHARHARLPEATGAPESEKIPA